MYYNKIYLDINYEHFEYIDNYRSIDELVTLKIHNEYTNVDEYYDKSSSKTEIDKLDTPTLFINSRDDLLAPIYKLDLTKCKIY